MLRFGRRQMTVVQIQIAFYLLTALDPGRFEYLVWSTLLKSPTSPTSKI